MMLIGLIWAATAPLLLLLPGALVFRLLARSGWSPRRRGALAAVLVAGPVAALWLADHRQFASICDEVAKPRISAQGNADGVFLDSPTANSFGTRYLYDQGFAWIEIRSIYRRGEYDRLSLEPGGSVRTEPVAKIGARFEVRESHERPDAHTSLSLTSIIDRETGTRMASAGTAHFDGGRAKWVLGAYGSRSCPSAMSDSENFRIGYNLAQYTLRPQGRNR